MLNEVAKQWVAALRSGEYKQGTSQLKRDDKFCCLGVLCELAVKAGIIESADYMERYYDNGSTWSAVAPPAVKEWAGMKTQEGGYNEDDQALSLIHDNDNGVTFEGIANIIESKADEIFKD